MSKGNVKDMTSGNEVQLLLAFAIPMILGNIIQQLYNLVDAVIVGQYVGEDALGAVGSIGSINFIFFSLCFGLTAGIGILVSQYFGARNDKYVKKTIANAIYLILSVGVIVSVLGVALSRPILKFMNTPDKNFDYALTYMRITIGATVVVAVYNGISAILRALGDSKTPLIFLAVSSVINIILDFLFVLVFDMEVAGVAWATIISQGISAVGSIIYAYRINPYLKLTKDDMVFDKELIKQSVKTGMPVAAQNAMIAISCIALQRVVNGYGTKIMAAYTATGRIEQIVHQPFNSLGVAMSTFAGQNMGARKVDRVIRGTKKAEVIAFIFSMVMLAVMFMFDRNIVGIFIGEPDVIDIGSKALRITSLCYFGLGSIYTLRGALNGVGDVTYSMINGICEVVCRIVFVTLIALIPGVDYWCVWIAHGLTWVVTGIAGAIRFVRGKWKNKVLVS